MNINELKSFRLSDAVHFHDTLNPALWDDEQLIPEVREQLLEIASDFMEHLGVSDLGIVDITLSGSNAAYTYTKHSDIDLHLIADIEKLANDEIYRELFTSKKTVYNDSHDIKIHGYDVELYVQLSTEPVKSLGEYSVLKDRWIRRPSARRSAIEQTATKHKFTKLVQLCELALRSDDVDRVQQLLDTIKKYRGAGLEFGGEFGPENLVYKALRSRGIIDQLYAHRDELHSASLSLDEEVLDEISRRGFLQGAASAATLGAVGVPLSAQAGKYKDKYEMSSDERWNWILMINKIQNRLNVIFKKLLNAAGSDAKYFSDVGVVAVFDEGFGRANFKQRLIELDITVYHDLSDDAIAFTIAHEMGHFRYNHRHAYGPNTVANHKIEYDADRYGVMLGLRAGFNPRQAFATLIDNPTVGKESTNTHPSYDQRVQKLRGAGYRDVKEDGSAPVVSKQALYQLQGTKEMLARYLQSDAVREETQPDNAALSLDEQLMMELAGNRPTPSIESVAKKHGVSVEKIKSQLGSGIKVELEHTRDRETAREIALDHLSERPDYYSVLNRVGLEESKAYHVTATRNVKSIMKNGLVPRIGDRSAKISNEQRGVFVFPTKNDAENAVMNWLGDEFDEDEELTLLAINLDGLESKVQRGADYELIVDTRIEPSRISVVDDVILEASGYIPSEAERNDPRFSTALTVDVTPNSIADNVRKLGLGPVARAGVPQTMRGSGKVQRSTKRSK